MSGSYDRFEETVILEDFLNKIDPEVRTYLADECDSTSAEAAVNADQGSLPDQSQPSSC